VRSGDVVSGGPVAQVADSPVLNDAGTVASLLLGPLGHSGGLATSQAGLVLSVGTVVEGCTLKTLGRPALNNLGDLAPGRSVQKTPRRRCWSMDGPPLSHRGGTSTSAQASP
jgi:hypothetical protein